MKSFKRTLLSGIIVFMGAPVAMAAQSRISNGPQIRNNGNAVAERHILGPSIQNTNDEAIAERHILGPTIKNNNEAVAERHNLGPVIENNNRVVAERHNLQNEKEVEQTSQVATVLDLNQE